MMSDSHVSLLLLLQLWACYVSCLPASIVVADGNAYNNYEDQSSSAPKSNEIARLSPRGTSSLLALRNEMPLDTNTPTASSATAQSSSLSLTPNDSPTSDFIITNTTGTANDLNFRLSVPFSVPETNIAGVIYYKTLDIPIDIVAINSCLQKIQNLLLFEKEFYLVEHYEYTVGEVTAILDPVPRYIHLIGVRHEEAERALRALEATIMLEKLYRPIEFSLFRFGQDVAYGFIQSQIRDPVISPPSGVASSKK